VCVDCFVAQQNDAQNLEALGKKVPGMHGHSLDEVSSSSSSSSSSQKSSRLQHFCGGCARSLDAPSDAGAPVLSSPL